MIPCIDAYQKVDLRTVSFDVPPQEVTMVMVMMIMVVVMAIMMIMRMRIVMIPRLEETKIQSYRW